MGTGKAWHNATIAFISIAALSNFIYFSLDSPAQSSQDGGVRLQIIGPTGPSTLDPHAVSDAFTVSLLANFYEPLVRRAPDLSFQGGLARQWERLDPLRWRFYLRDDVRFHDGQAFQAADVVHSYERSIAEGSRVVARMAGIADVVEVDPRTVDVVTTEPLPLLLNQLDAWLVVGRDVGDPPGDAEAVTPDTMNGTGPFRIEDFEIDGRLAATAFSDWWRQPDHNLSSVDYRVVETAATRLAAIMADDADIVLSVPLQDVDRLEASDGMHIVPVDEPRAVFLGMTQARPDGTPTPLADERLRRAIGHAVDVDTLIEVVMRGRAVPVAVPIARQVAGYPADLERRAHDPALARELVAAAGHGEDGVSLAFDCPNDRYVNDEALCTAIAGMLAAVGISVELRVEPGAIMTSRLYSPSAPEPDPGLYLTGWMPSSLDSGRVLADLVAGPDVGRRFGAANITRFSDPELDALIAAIQGEDDERERIAMIARAWRMVHDHALYVPLHQQLAFWAVADDVVVTPRRDGALLWNDVRLQPGSG